VTDAIWGYGTLLELGDGIGGFVTIAEVMDFPGPQLSRDNKDVTSHSSPNGYDEFIMTLKRSGEMGFTLNFFNDATQDFSTGVGSLYDSGEIRPWRITAPASVFTIEFEAYVSGFKTQFPVNGQITADTTLKLSGQVVFA